ncbi:MAG: helix-turn-helix domain-containing protein [Geminicoccaceae bacterium]
MRVTKEKAAEHRAAIVTAASRLFRQRGFDGVGVAEIMKAAGLTHGGFYGHFASKEALAAEACGEAFVHSMTRLQPGAADILDYLDSYLSELHRDRPDKGCPMAAFADEIARQSTPVQSEFTTGTAQFIDVLVQRLEHFQGEGTAERRSRAIAILAAMVGGMALARATAGTSPELSADILASVRAQLDRTALGQSAVLP